MKRVIIPTVAGLTLLVGAAVASADGGVHHPCPSPLWKDYSHTQNTPVAGEVWIKAGNQHHPAGYHEAGWDVPAQWDVNPDPEVEELKDTSHHDGCGTTPTTTTTEATTSTSSSTTGPSSSTSSSQPETSTTSSTSTSSSTIPDSSTSSPPVATTTPPSTTQPATSAPPPSTLPTPELTVYDKRCGGVITVKSTRKVEVVVEPIGYHFDASSTPATLGLAPGSYTLEINGETFASFVIEACPKPTTTTVPPVVVDIADPVVPPTTTAPARPDLPATR